MRAIEFFCGIGGFAAAFPGEVSLAIDQDRFALATYKRNFPHPISNKTIASIATESLAAIEADLWWASPPCQPFTIKGSRRLLGDPRAKPLSHLLGHLAAVRPRHFAMENVLGFADSPGETLVRETLKACGYGHIRTFQICPTALGIPNRRPRFYLVASRQPLTPIPNSNGDQPCSLADFLRPQDGRMAVPGAWLEKYRPAMDILIPQAPDAIAQTFTSSYGKSPSRSGSYLEDEAGGIRFFSSREILNLLGFPAEFQFPESATPRQIWKRLGNSLSVPVVARVLQSFSDPG